MTIRHSRPRLLACVLPGLLAGMLCASVVPAQIEHSVQRIEPVPGAFGEPLLSATWPAGIPVGTEIWLQFIVQNPSTPDGLTLSDAVMAVTP